MNEVSEAIACWLEKKRRAERVSAAVLSVLALGGGATVFLVTTLLIYTVLFTVSGSFVHSVPWLGLAVFAVTAGFFALTIKLRQNELDLYLDPVGFWIIRDISSIGPRLLLEGLRQVRRCGKLGDLNVAVCAGALAYLAKQNAAITWEELIRHCPQLPSAHLKEQLFLLDGVLFLGEEDSRVTLMTPFRLLLRSMLERELKAGKWEEPAAPRREPTPQAMAANEPEMLSPYEILGLPPSASVAEIRIAYRKRVKACHPDLFAGMDQQARALAERWTKALNAAYATLNPRHRGARPGSMRQR